MARAQIAWIVACLLAGCPEDSASDSDAALAADGGMLPDDVDAVLGRNCRVCHSRPPTHEAPFPLVTYDDTQAQHPSYPAGTPVFEVMQMRIHDPDFPMPPAGRTLSDVDRQVLDEWIQLGAKPAR